VNGIYYINANLPAAQATFTGADDRPRYVGVSCTNPTVGECVTRINNSTGNQVENAIVLKNQDVGRSWVASASLEKQFGNGFFAKAAYSYGESKNTVDPGSIAFGSWSTNQHPGDPNNPGIGYALNSPGKRYFVAASYRKEYFTFGATSVSAFWEARQPSVNYSYTYSGDLNGDLGSNNDLIYIPKDTSEMVFEQYTINSGTATAKTFTVAQQKEAFETYINNDEYLREHRGAYAQRGALFLPLVRRMDVSLTQELFRNVMGQRNGLQLRADILNFGNLLNKKWGVGQRYVFSSTRAPFNSQPLLATTPDAQGRARYRLRTINDQLVTTPLEKTSNLADVYSVQISLRYTFN
jgi:hypothetical protein